MSDTDTFDHSILQLKFRCPKPDTRWNVLTTTMHFLMVNSSGVPKEHFTAHISPQRFVSPSVARGKHNRTSHVVVFGDGCSQPAEVTESIAVIHEVALIIPSFQGDSKGSRDAQSERGSQITSVQLETRDAVLILKLFYFYLESVASEVDGRA